MKEIVFIIEESQDGSYFARAVNHSIFTQGNTIAELKSMIGDAVRCHFDSFASFILSRFKLLSL